MSAFKSMTQCLAFAVLTSMAALQPSIASDSPGKQKQVPSGSWQQLAAGDQELPLAARKPNFKAVLTGNADAFPAFHQALLKYLKTQTIEQGAVACIGCNEVVNDLQTQKPMRRYTFVASADMFAKFGAAMNDVRTKDLELTFSGHDQPEPTCGTKPQPCVQNYGCPFLGNCARSKAGCTPCT